MTQQGYLLISDISGYTSFLTQAELEHAQEILESLFDALLANLKAPLTISKMEGDAIFAYAPAGSFLRGQTLLETIENAYCVFAQTLEAMHHNTTCTCKACQLIPTLDLKFVVHYGTFILSKRQELSGPDVILVHRLLKNEIIATSGIKAYAFFTAATIEQMRLNPQLLEMTAHQESYEHLGVVSGYVYDLHPIWVQEREKRLIQVSPEETDLLVQFDLPVPPPIVWDYLQDAAIQQKVRDATALTIVANDQGRIGVGAVHHCAHGAQTNDELIVDWRPFTCLTMKSHLRLPFGGIYFTQLYSVFLQATDQGTTVSYRFARIESPSWISLIVATLIWKLSYRRYLGQLFGVENCKILTKVIARDIQEGKIVLPTAVY